MPCPYCGKQNDPGAHFCFHCGKQLRGSDIPTSLGAKITLYAASVLIPPFGILRTIKYMKSADPAAQQMGLISLILTIVTLVATVWLALAAFSSATTTFGL